MRGTARPVIGAHINLGSFYFVGVPVTVGLTFWFKLNFDEFCCWASKLADESNGAATAAKVQSRKAWPMGFCDSSTYHQRDLLEFIVFLW